MDLTGLTKLLSVPHGSTVPRTLSHGAVAAHAITRDDLDDDVAGINASLELIRRTRGGSLPSEPVTPEGNDVDLATRSRSRSPLTEEMLRHDVDVSWWVTPTAYDAGLYTAVHEAVRHWCGTDLPFTDPFWSNDELP